MVVHSGYAIQFGMKNEGILIGAECQAKASMPKWDWWGIN